MSRYAHPNVKEVAILTNTQGMSFIALIPLAVMKGDAERAFWLFFAVMTKAVSPDTFGADPPLAGHRADAGLLAELCKEKVPDLVRAVGEDDFNGVCALLSTKWLLCLYANALPRESVLHLWDSMLCLEGTRAADVIALRSTPLFVWAIGVLLAVKADVIKQAKRLSSDIPKDIEVAEMIMDAAKQLPPGFKVDWTNVPHWDAVKLKRRHAAVEGVWERKPTKALRHVWGPTSEEEVHIAPEGSALNFLLEEKSVPAPSSSVVRNEASPISSWTNACKSTDVSAKAAPVPDFTALFDVSEVPPTPPTEASELCASGEFFAAIDEANAPLSLPAADAKPSSSAFDLEAMFGSESIVPVGGAGGRVGGPNAKGMQPQAQGTFTPPTAAVLMCFEDLPALPGDTAPVHSTPVANPQAKSAPKEDAFKSLWESFGK